MSSDTQLEQAMRRKKYESKDTEGMKLKRKFDGSKKGWMGENEHAVKEDMYYPNIIVLP